jgi:hypothetical protein
VALATFATITANGGITRATAETITAASVEYRSMTAQESTNKPMQVAISAKYQRLSVRDGCGPGSLSLPVTSVGCPGPRRLKRGRRGVRARGGRAGYVHMHVR